MRSPVLFFFLSTWIDTMTQTPARVLVFANYKMAQSPDTGAKVEICRVEADFLSNCDPKPDYSLCVVGWIMSSDCDDFELLGIQQDDEITRPSDTIQPYDPSNADVLDAGDVVVADAVPVSRHGQATPMTTKRKNQCDPSHDDDVQPTKKKKKKKTGPKRKTFECDHCDKSFKSKGGWKAHARRDHSDVVAVTCTSCPTNSNSSGNFSSSSTEIGPTSVVATHDCALCGKQYRSKGALNKHHNSKHLQPVASTPKPQQKVDGDSLALLQCHLCPRNYQHRWSLSRHLTKEHDEDIDPVQAVEDDLNAYVCVVCHKRFSYERCMQEHALRRHPSE